MSQNVRGEIIDMHFRFAEKAMPEHCPVPMTDVTEYYNLLHVESAGRVCVCVCLCGGGEGSLGYLVIWVTGKKGQENKISCVKCAEVGKSSLWRWINIDDDGRRSITFSCDGDRPQTYALLRRNFFILFILLKYECMAVTRKFK